MVIFWFVVDACVTLLQTAVALKNVLHFPLILSLWQIQVLVHTLPPLWVQNPQPHQTLLIFVKSNPNSSRQAAFLLQVTSPSWAACLLWLHSSRAHRSMCLSLQQVRLSMLNVRSLENKNFVKCSFFSSLHYPFKLKCFLICFANLFPHKVDCCLSLIIGILGPLTVVSYIYVTYIRD